MTTNTFCNHFDILYAECKVDNCFQNIACGYIPPNVTITTYLETFNKYCRRGTSQAVFELDDVSFYPQIFFCKYNMARQV